MNLREVCKAFLDNEKLESDYNTVYKLNENGELVFQGLSEWNKSVELYPFEHPEKMKIYVEYDLTFFEAMRKANEGWIISNDDWIIIEYVMHDGIPYYFGNGEIVASFQKNELQAKWKVVRKVEE